MTSYYRVRWVRKGWWSKCYVLQVSIYTIFIVIVIINRIMINLIISVFD